MKGFIRDALLVIAFGVLILVPLEWKIGQRQWIYQYKNWYLTQRSDDIKVLLLGHSLFATSLNPHALGDSVFSAASPARHLYYDRLLAERHLPNLRNLKTVLFPLHTEMPYDPADVAINQFGYARYMHLYPEGKRWKWSAFLMGELNLENMKDYPAQKEIPPEQTFSELVTDSIGYLPRYRVWDPEKMKPYVPRDEVCRENREGYKAEMLRLARVCHDVGVRLILVMPPHSDDCINLSDPERKMIGSVREVVHEVQQVYPRVELLDYYEDSAFRSPSLYDEGYHLNHTGATLLAQRIKADADL